MITNLLPGVSPTVLALVLVGLTGGVLFIIGGLGAMNPVLLRMGLRNMVRRPTQTLILLCGLVLSTIVITASFGLSDSFANSALTDRLAAMGNVDESVTGPFTQSQLNSALEQIRGASSVQVVSAIHIGTSSLTFTSERTGLSIHDVDVYAVPPDFDQVYGPVSDIGGQTEHFADLGANQIYVSASIARNFDVRPGDKLQYQYDNLSITSTVRALLSNDLGVTAGEAIGAEYTGYTPEVILPLARLQQLYQQVTRASLVPNTICIKNIGKGGMDDTGPGGSRSQAVVRLLQQIFPGATTSLTVSGSLGSTDFGSFRIHPLKPDVVNAIAIQFTKLVFFSTAGQQFAWLPLIFTCLLVGASMLLLVLLIILLSTERRAELGMSRALGLQRSHLIQLQLFEGCGYSVVASLVGVVLGFGATALELAVLAQVPQLAPGEDGSNPLPVPVFESLHVWLSWQSALSAGCLGFLTTLVIVWLTAIWISRTEIVTAIRDLDTSPKGTAQLLQLMRALWTPPLDAAQQPLPETPARRLARVTGTMGQLFSSLWLRGPLCLLAGFLLLALANGEPRVWLRQIAIALVITSLGFFVTWSGLPSRAWKAQARRLGSSLIGLGWLIYGLLSDHAFLALFQPVVSSTPPLLPEILLSMLLLVSGAVVLVMTNADLLVYALGPLLQRIPRLAPVGRTSLIYPITFRFRTGVTVALLSLITFLVLMLVTTNLGAIQEAQAATNSGGFQLEVPVFGGLASSDNDLNLQLQGLQAHTVLSQDFTVVGLLRVMYDLTQSRRLAPVHLDLAGQPIYPLSLPPLVADDAFLASSTMPFYARAQGFSSDQQVWQALREHTGYAVIQYDARVLGLPADSGFEPFRVELPVGADTATAHSHTVTIIGLMPASAPWRMIMSVHTAGSVVQPPYTQALNTYLFRLRDGVGEAQATSDLNRTLDATRRGIYVQSLDHATFNGITAVFTVFLGSYLALGLLFGAFAIGVIASRAVVERRQQIGMLRALGFSRGLVGSSFVLESSFVIALSLVIGAALALWLAYQVARATYQNFPLPVGPIVLILLGSFLVVCISVALPARRAARVHPAEALRYE